MTTALEERTAADSGQVVVDWSALSVDIETNPADGNRIFKIGAVRSDNDTVLSLSTGHLAAQDVVRKPEAAGHKAPGCWSGTTFAAMTCRNCDASTRGSACLDLPVLDTLELSAIAFPANPYHRLVKGYKLLSDSRNDPVKDARLTPRPAGR